MRPLIGIPCHAGLRADTARPIYGNNRAYVHAVEHAGGVPVLIPLLGDLSSLNSLLPRLDGLLLSGGIDIQPQLYGEQPHPKLGEVDPHLDALELALARWAIHEQIPTLGICRGHQLINVALGGSLYQDLESMLPGSLHHWNWDQPRNRKVQTVHIEPGSRLAQILGTQSIEVNSLHHQSVKKPGRGVRITGYTKDGIAEMLEIPGHPFMLGVQCHPEELYLDDPTWTKLFVALIEACVAPVVRTLTRVEQTMSVGAI
jgi:putative glutamine amidotransferase